jgi:hypothetical protein
MPVARVRLSEAISKPEFHRRLRAWFTETDETTIGPTDVDERTAWVHVRDGASCYKLHADAYREAVAAYLALVDRHGDGLAWEVVPNLRGRENAVGFGPDAVRPTPPLYLYLVEPA